MFFVISIDYRIQSLTIVSDYRIQSLTIVIENQLLTSYI